MTDKRVRHNHVTRDIKQPGICPACDQFHDIEAARAEADGKAAPEEASA